MRLVTMGHLRRSMLNRVVGSPVIREAKDFRRRAFIVEAELETSC
jgi:hypothetical protein